MAHCIDEACGERIGRLWDAYEVVWATGWEEKANEYLPYILSLPASELPVLTFEGRAVFGTAHWKLDAIAEYAGERPAAWVDDSIDEECERWARERRAPTLLIHTRPEIGLREQDVDSLLGWAEELRRGHT